ncbi:MAG TPA: 2Fe-2S iron-sulfur cluster-binding protein [Syntrophales bacterium]|nr:2Fe-2S iron-sulfur cluster-binding protein [Syntrophales bacterium]
MLNVTIDGKKLEAKDGETILQVCQANHVRIPTLCFHKDLTPFGACRLCVVEVKTDGKWQLASSCDTLVRNKMEVRTNTDRVKESRKLAAELLCYKYPSTKAVRDMAESLGVEVPGGKADGGDCILCGLCTRTCHEIVGVDALKFLDRGLGRSVSEPRIEYIADACIGCGSCAYVCPTGFVKMEASGDRRVIWDKSFKMTACDKCGRYFAPEEQLKWISRKTGVPMSKLTVCTSCR